MGFGITRSFRPFKSSTLTMGLRLLVKLRKPVSQNPSPTRPFSGSLDTRVWPNGPANIASTCSALLNENGMSSSVNSLTTPPITVAEGMVMSSTPPCTALNCCCSPPTTPPPSSWTFILPPLRAATSSANFWVPSEIGWPGCTTWPKRMICSWACAGTAAHSAARAAMEKKLRIFMDCLLFGGGGWSGRFGHGKMLS